MSATRNASGFSRRVRLFALAGAFAALVGVHAGCNGMGGPKGPLSVPLKFTPNRADPISGTLEAKDVTVHLAAVEDNRDNKEEIGRNVEDATPVPVYASGKTPAEFVRDVLEEELKNLGAELSDAPEAADRVVQLELRKFFTEEGNSYRGEVQCAVEVRDKGGRSLWRQIVTGQGENSGRSLSVVNYNETFSDATRRMVEKIITNPGFQQALTR